MVKDELDILKEVATIASGHGSIALSEFLQKKISLSIPSIEVISLDDNSRNEIANKKIIAIFTRILSGLSGEVIFIIDEKNAFNLMELSYPLYDLKGETGVITEGGISLIKEVGSIVICSYLNALSLTIKQIIIPGSFSFISGYLDEVLKIILSRRTYPGTNYLLQSEFSAASGQFSGSFYFLLPAAAAESIRGGCVKLLEEINKENK